MPPPPGVESNFVDPVSIGYEVYVAAAVCMPLILSFTMLRVYAKMKVFKKRTKDDCEFLRTRTSVKFHLTAEKQ